MNSKNSHHIYLIKIITIWGIILLLIVAMSVLRETAQQSTQTANAQVTSPLIPKLLKRQSADSLPASVRKRDSIKSSSWHKGMRIYRYWWRKRQAAIYVAEMDRDAKDLRFGVELANGTVVGRETISAMAQRLEARDAQMLAGVNGSFGIREDGMGQGGMIFNLHIQDWELVSIPPRLDRWGYSPPTPWGETSFGVTIDGEFLMDGVQLNGVIHIEGEELKVDGINQLCDWTCPVVIYTPRFGAQTRTRRNYEVILRKLQLPLKGKYSSQFVVKEINPIGNSMIPSRGVVLSLDSQSARMWQSKFVEGRKGILEISLSPSEWQHVPDGIGGNIRLLRDGEIEPELVNFHRYGGEYGRYDDSNRARLNPRSAMGFNDEKLFLIVVDGRQMGYSMGMTFYDMAEFFRDIGVKHAINFDGGSSSALWGVGSIINRPSHGQERLVFNVAAITTRGGEK